jgi:hypothetical protein
VVHSLGVQRSALVVFSRRTLQENETLERYYTTSQLVVYPAVDQSQRVLTAHLVAGTEELAPGAAIPKHTPGTR